MRATPFENLAAAASLGLFAIVIAFSVATGCEENTTEVFVEDAARIDTVIDTVFVACKPKYFDPETGICRKRGHDEDDHG